MSELWKTIETDLSSMPSSGRGMSTLPASTLITGTAETFHIARFSESTSCTTQRPATRCYRTYFVLLSNDAGHVTAWSPNAIHGALPGDTVTGSGPSRTPTDLARVTSRIARILLPPSSSHTFSCLLTYVPCTPYKTAGSARHGSRTCNSKFPARRTEFRVGRLSSKGGLACGRRHVQNGAVDVKPSVILSLIP
ncbi:hypothetical protein OH76DRAFT_1405246 [Lentinus brumalis]|uniref:Uncharacterized protein n=1 Tax=Lentinus brumalis TaxID=2498619 RepID=A0A371D649_9APHY|nr:hypothetical protein OH76DRAFT_1405246 [Polyporus brumalis]